MAQHNETAPNRDLVARLDGKDIVPAAVHDEIVLPDEKVNDRNLMIDNAIQAEQAEQSMSLWESLKTYKRAILWSMAISLVIVMDGYDTGCVFSQELGVP